MNIPLLDPFESNQFPEVIEDILEDYGATICAFNRRGTLLAVGCTSGVVAVVDLVTRGIATYLPGHGRPLSAICWARNGRWYTGAAMTSAKMPPQHGRVLLSKRLNGRRAG